MRKGLVEWIHKKRKEGQTEHQLHQFLMNIGHSPQQAQEILNKTSHKHIGWIVILGALLLIAATAATAAIILFSDIANKPQPYLEESETQTCASIESKEYREECYFNLALRSKRVSLCHSIETPHKVDKCLQSFATRMLSPLFCTGIENQTIRDDCYTNIARKSKKPHVCNSATDRIKVDDCLSFFNAAHP